MEFDEVDKRMISFCGKIIETTVVTDKPYIADKWVQNLIISNHQNQKLIVGFDCKYKMSHPIRSMNQDIVTLQLCVDTSCLVLKLSHPHSVPESIKFLLNYPKVCLFGVEIHDNLSKLERGYGIKCCGKVVDIRALVKIMFPLMTHFRLSKLSLRGIAYKVAGLSARGRNTSGSDRELFECSSVDAYACHAIAINLLR